MLSMAPRMPIGTLINNLNTYEYEDTIRILL